VSQYQKGRINLDFTEARDSECQWHQLGHMQVCTSLQTDNHTSTPSFSLLQAGCPSCRPTNSVKALKAQYGPIMSTDCIILINLAKLILRINVAAHYVVTVRLQYIALLTSKLSSFRSSFNILNVVKLSDSSVAGRSF